MTWVNQLAAVNSNMVLVVKYCHSNIVKILLELILTYNAVG